MKWNFRTLVLIAPALVAGALSSARAQVPATTNAPSPATRTSADPAKRTLPPVTSATPTPATSATPLMPTPTTATPASTSTTSAPIAPLSLDEAIRIAQGQASAFQQAGLNERIAAEDVRQARAAFLPRVALAPSFIGTTPALGASTAPGIPRAPSFIGANAITEYQGLVNVSGELDIAGRLRASVRRNQALLDAARAGTDVARRTLTLAVEDSYNSLALAGARRRSAEQSLAAAEEFERITNLLLSGGEVAPVDATRARLQTTTRRDELEQARTAEAAATDALRIFVNYDFTQALVTTDLLVALPETGEIERYVADAIATRPEFAQFAAEGRAAELDITLARAERRPQLTYSVSGGFVSDSLRPLALRTHTGASATVGVAIPLFDGGASRSRERQARLRADAAESARTIAARAFAQEFYTARAQALSAATRIRLAGTGIADAERNVSASLARYRAGEASIIEVTDAQNSLIAERNALYQAVFDYQSARSRLRRASGQ